MAPDIFRNPTEAEKADFKEIPLEGSLVPSFIEEFKKKVEKTEANYVKQFKPFCARCARLDFQDLTEKARLESERTVGYVTDLEKLKVKSPDLTAYGKEDRFVFIKEQDAMEPVTNSVGTTQRQVKIGVHRDYRCTVRGCGISLFVSNEDIKKQEKKEK